MDFNGSGAHVIIPDHPSLDLTTGITLEAWIRADSWGPNHWSNNIISKETWAGGNETGYTLRCGNNGRLSLNLGQGGSNGWHEVISTGPVLSLNKWHHVAGTWDGTVLRIYADGRPLNSTAWIGTMGTNNVEVKIGRLAFINENRFFDGEIEEVRIWNVARSMQQIRENMHRTLSGAETGLVSYYQLNDSTGSLIASDPISNNNGMLSAINVIQDWKISSCPVGKGFSNSQTEMLGNLVFPTTGLEMNYGLMGFDLVTITRINQRPYNPPAGALDFQYWVSNRLSNISGFKGHFELKVREPLNASHQANPRQFELYHRPFNSDSAWIRMGSITSVDLINNSLICSSIADTEGQWIVVSTINAIPTLSQWALIFLALCLMGLSMLFIGQKKLAFSGFQNHYFLNSSFTSFFIYNKNMLLKALKLGFLFLLLAIAFIFYFEKGFSIHNFWGLFFCFPVLVYVIHLLFLFQIKK